MLRCADGPTALSKKEFRVAVVESHSAESAGSRPAIHCLQQFAMARRRTRRHEAAEEEQDEEEQQQLRERSRQQPKPTPRQRARHVEQPEPEEEQEGNDDDGNQGQEGQRQAAVASDTHDSEPNSNDQLPSLRFDEQLSWRPTKAIPSSTLIARLERLSKELADFDQGEVNLDSLKAVAASLAHRNLIQHKDRGVRSYTACCLVDLLRLYVPDAPFTGDQLKMMFGLFVKDILPALFDAKSPYSSQHKYVLVSLAEVKSILLMTEIHGADDLMLRLFKSTFDGLSSSSKAPADEQVDKDVEIHLTDMLMELIDESPGSISASIVDAVISQFLRAAPPGGSSKERGNSPQQSNLLPKTAPPAYLMAQNICNGCADKMSRYVSQYFGDVILNASSFALKGYASRRADDSDQEDAASSGPSDADVKNLGQAHMLIRELWRAAPSILEGVVPQLDLELSADNVHLRLLATETIGDMISGIGIAGPPPRPVLDAAAYPTLRLMEDNSLSDPAQVNVLTRPQAQHSFAQTHPETYKSFVGRHNDKAGVIRSAWATAAGYILSTSAGGIGLSRDEEKEVVKGLAKQLYDVDEKVRLAAIESIEVFSYPDFVLKLGCMGGVDKEGSILASLADRCRDKKATVRAHAMVLLAKMWAVATGDIAEGQEAVMACLSGVPSRIINAFYAGDAELSLLLDRVMFECLVPLKYPQIKTKTAKKPALAKGGLGSADNQDKIRAERILLLLKDLDVSAQQALFAMQARQPRFAQGVSNLIRQCEAYNGGVVDANEEKIKSALAQTLQWLGALFPDPAKVRSDLQKFAKLNDRRSYQLVKYAIEPENDFKTVRRAINELVSKLQSSAASACLDTMIPLLYRSGCLLYNRSHLGTILEYSRSNKDGLAAVAHSVLNDISQRNPEVFKAHAEDLRREIEERAPSDGRGNDGTVVDILKAYASYAKRYPDDINLDRSFIQTLTKYTLFGSPPKSAKYAVNILLAKNDAKAQVTATSILRGAVKDLTYDSPHLLARLRTIVQLERVTRGITSDEEQATRQLTLNTILPQVRSCLEPDVPLTWVDDHDMDKELQAKCLSLKFLVSRCIANEDTPGFEDEAKQVLALVKSLIVNEGEVSKDNKTPMHHKKRLRLLAGLLTLKMCTIKKYDELLDPSSFNKLAELVQDSQVQVRRRFMDKLQEYLTQANLRVRFLSILFLAAYEPVTELKARVEGWLRARAQYYSQKKQQVLEAIMARLIPLLAHHPDYSANLNDLADFANYFLFYLGAVATQDNISLIYKYAERVKQTQDAIKPQASQNLYVLSDLAQTVIRKYQERKNWSFQAWPDKVGLPTGLFTALPSSGVALQIAKKQYIPEELDERLDDMIRSMDRKKKRKSINDAADAPAKRAKTQAKATAREKGPGKAAAGKGAPRKKKPTKTKTVSRSKKPSASSPVLPDSERRRSSRAHKVSDYKERDDADDEEEMLDGVAEWDYMDEDGEEQEEGEEEEALSSDAGQDADDSNNDETSDKEPAAVDEREEAQGSGHDEQDEEEEQEQDEDDDDDDDDGSLKEKDDEKSAPLNKGSKRATAASKARPAIKNSVLARIDRTRHLERPRRGGRGAREAAEMYVHDNDD
ncbi:hypothetical protein CDD81_6156 [Ophiocordyceps australis]|uniref:Sister chromatid cohesion protein n=1 Tax=Ophiocordyceps australis TaxID=1399860 RepID=A0A2C5Y8C2_9HYPO|nr:hypothetical protein CDD81_6156 [Ophiocordyceps australis]